MPGRPVSSSLCPRPRDLRRGAALTLALLGALGGLGSAVGSGYRPGDPGAGGRASAALARTETPAPGATRPGTADRDAVARAAAEAVAEGKSAKNAAQDVVSRSGDRWGVVYDQGEYASFEDDLDGRYTGVGLWAERAPDGRIQVSRVQPGGPAALAGLRAGDRLTRVDDAPVTGLAVAQVVARLRGGAGTAVTLEVERAGAALTATVRRARVNTEAVTVRQLAEGVVVIKVASFTRGSGERVREAVRAAPSGAGVLLDLRGNPGGLVTEAVTAASAFLDGGLVATYDVRGAQRALYADRGGDTARPLVALVDGGTMSAAELVTGALQDRGRAVTVGSHTFGKGSVQMPTELADGSVAELTVGTYRTPAGRSLDGRGIVPDLTADERVEERARQVLGGLGVGP
ncbi:S41 family peptidase [Streptomyces sp. G-G2]|uniref:S41 family peptidase n=1 Tax=Streptomyces sp. G-G2 TaxID=3046201 RepID=UPI0024BAD532|nr:S41 family peptidase [Streptomyces sp. G-G2]MDJ0379560.1 S41 family peptidase [Streptomyces sp. G-G2]